jgi:hypothetical protein
MSCAVWIPGSGRLTPSSGWSVRGVGSSCIVGQLPIAGTMGALRFLRAVATGATLTAEDASRREQCHHPEWVALSPAAHLLGLEVV